MNDENIRKKIKEKNKRANQQMNKEEKNILKLLCEAFEEDETTRIFLSGFFMAYVNSIINGTEKFFILNICESIIKNYELNKKQKEKLQTIFTDNKTIH